MYERWERAQKANREAMALNSRALTDVTDRSSNCCGRTRGEPAHREEPAVKPPRHESRCCPGCSEIRILGFGLKTHEKAMPTGLLS